MEGAVGVICGGGSAVCLWYASNAAQEGSLTVFVVPHLVGVGRLIYSTGTLSMLADSLSLRAAHRAAVAGVAALRARALT